MEKNIFKLLKQTKDSEDFEESNLIIKQNSTGAIMVKPYSEKLEKQFSEMIRFGGGEWSEVTEADLNEVIQLESESADLETKLKATETKVEVPKEETKAETKTEAQTEHKKKGRKKAI